MSNRGHDELSIPEDRQVTDHYYALIGELENGKRVFLRSLTREEYETMTSEQKTQETRALFIGGPLDGQIIDVGEKHEWVHPLGDGSKQVYLHNRLAARGQEMIAFTMGIMDADTILITAMRHPEGDSLWRPVREAADGR